MKVLHLLQTTKSICSIVGEIVPLEDPSALLSASSMPKRRESAREGRALLRVL